MYFKVRHPSISSSHSQNYVKDSNYYQDFDEEERNDKCKIGR